MALNVAHDHQSMQELEQAQEVDTTVGCSIGIMAYNEEANIGRTIRAVLEQTGPSMRIEEVIVVASGCTDRTVPLVAEIVAQDPRTRKGRSSLPLLRTRSRVGQTIVRDTSGTIV